MYLFRCLYYVIPSIRYIDNDGDPDQPYFHVVDKDGENKVRCLDNDPFGNY